MIRFGSRTEVYLPLNAEVLVAVGDKVKGGSSVIAKLK
jgi:phosphatidylserine decarboxylase